MPGELLFRRNLVAVRPRPSVTARASAAFRYRVVIFSTGLPVVVHGAYENGEV
jgi:hypothetical protein